MKKSIFSVLLIFAAAVLSANEINTDELFQHIQAKWAALQDYTCVLETYSKKGEKEQTSTIEQKFLKPKWIRMQITEGDGKGSIGVYNPFTKKVRGCKTGILKIVVLTLEITDSRVSSIRGHRIDQGDFLTMLERLEDYHTSGEITSIERTTYNEKPAYLFKAEVTDTSKLWGAQKESIWLSEDNLLPLRSEQRLGDNTLVHSSTYRDIKIDTGLTEEDFKL
jgi:outer membrane lipoprotein-sorting protein